MADTRGRQAVKITDPTTNANEMGVTATGSGKISLSEYLGTAIGAGNPVHATIIDEIVDNAGFTDGTSKLLVSGYIFDEVAGTALTENDAVAARVDSKRAQVMVIEDATTRGTRAAVTATGLAVDTELTAVAALSDALANPTITNISGLVSGFNGTTWDRLRVAAAYDGNAALTTTGLLVAGIGPGFSRRFNPANLGTAGNSASTVDTNGAGIAGVQVGTTTTGTFTIEASNDGTNWFAPAAIDVATGGSVQASNLTPTTGKHYNVNVAGMRQLRLRTVSTLGATMAHVITLGISEALVTVAGSVVDTELTAVAALADATANPTITNIASLLEGFNGTTWDRIRTSNGALADALANPGTGLVQVQDFLMGYNGSTWDRVRTANTGRLQVDVITGGGSNVPTSPTLSYQTSSALAAGSSVALTTAEAGGFKLWKVDVWASVPFKATLTTVDNAVESGTKGLGGGAAAQPWQFVSPHPNFVTLGTTAGLDAFRINVTNLDSNTAADVYANFYYAT